MKKTFYFEKKLLSGLKECGISLADISEVTPLGVAVSGGADSISLLLALSSFIPENCLRVITVDHGIRSEEESGGDALFVKDFCERKKIKCLLHKIPHGQLEKRAAHKSLSLEAEARRARYEAFDEFIKSEGLCALCLAHNQNDQTETLLMRFIQGSSSLGGIAQVRGKYIRPLLNFSRNEIESYLIDNKQEWRTDNTNYDVKYLRNRIRNILVPVLNEHFPAWQKSLLLGAKKSAVDEDYLSSLVNLESEYVGLKSKSLFFDRNYFFSLHDALKSRIFFCGLNKIGFGDRFPYSLFEQILSWSKERYKRLTFENLTISLDSEKLEFSLNDSPAEKSCIESGFSFVFDRTGETFETDDFTVSSDFNNKIQKHILILRAKKLQDFSEKDTFRISVKFPCLVRSELPGDKIPAKDGSEKAIKDIFSDWKIPPELRGRIPVVEEISASGGKSAIKAIFSMFSVTKNWIVEDAKL